MTPCRRRSSTWPRGGSSRSRSGSRARTSVAWRSALTAGPKEESKRWWKGFEKDVVTDAQRRGLCVDILDKRTVLWLSAAAAAPATVLGVLAGGRVGFGYWVVAFFFLGWVIVLRAGIALAVAVFVLLVAPKDIAALAAAVAVVAGLVVVWALVDLGSTREATGQILRLRAYGDDDDKRYYVAVDDGASATIRAWRVKPELYSPLRQYEIVTGTLTRNLRYVRAISQTESELTAAKVATAPRA